MAYLDGILLHGTHRLIPAKYSEGGSVLETLGLPADVIADLSELDAATNERRMAERGCGPAIGLGELLTGVPEAHIVNAAFCHPGPFGARFNDAYRGAWYAGAELETSVEEVAYHKQKFLRDMRVVDEVVFEYQDFLADFEGAFHHLSAEESETCLKAEPVPECYRPGQAVANLLLNQGSAGIVYPSVRQAGGTCIACFRPALVFYPRRGERYDITVRSGGQSVFKQRLRG